MQELKSEIQVEAEIITINNCIQRTWKRSSKRKGVPYLLMAPCYKEDRVQNTQKPALDGCFSIHLV